MNLRDAMLQMGLVENPTKKNIRELLEDGYFIITGIKGNHGTTVLKHVVHLENEIVILYKLSESTETEIFLTPVSAAVYTKKYFKVLWNAIFSSTEYFIVDTSCVLCNAKIYTNHFNFDYKEKINMLDKNTIIIFEEIETIKTTSAYIVPVGEPALTASIEEVLSVTKNVKITIKPSEADYAILAMPLHINPPRNDIFSVYDTSREAAASPSTRIIRILLSEFIGDKEVPPHTLLFWPQNYEKLFKKSKEEALVQAATELDLVITKEA